MGDQDNDGKLASIEAGLPSVGSVKLGIHEQLIALLFPKLLIKAKLWTSISTKITQDPAQLTAIERDFLESYSGIELQRQRNVFQIVSQAVQHLPPLALPSAVDFSNERADENEGGKIPPIDQDWASRFFADCQDISFEQLQDLYARVLAQKVHSPGTVSKSVLAALRYLDAETARIFSRLHPFVLHSDYGQHFLLPYDGQTARFYDAHNICYDDLLLLDEHRLVRTGRMHVPISHSAERSAHYAIAHQGPHRLASMFAFAGDPIAEVNAIEVFIQAYPLTHAGTQLANCLPHQGNPEFIILAPKLFIGEFLFIGSAPLPANSTDSGQHPPSPSPHSPSPSRSSLNPRADSVEGTTDAPPQQPRPQFLSPRCEDSVSISLEELKQHAVRHRRASKSGGQAQSDTSKETSDLVDLPAVPQGTGAPPKAPPPLPTASPTPMRRSGRTMLSTCRPILPETVGSRNSAEHAKGTPDTTHGPTIESCETELAATEADAGDPTVAQELAERSPTTIRINLNPRKGDP